MHQDIPIRLDTNVFQPMYNLSRTLTQYQVGENRYALWPIQINRFCCSYEEVPLQNSDK